MVCVKTLIRILSEPMNGNEAQLKGFSPLTLIPLAVLFYDQIHTAKSKLSR